MKSDNEVALADVALGIFDGPHATPPESDDGHVFLRLENITPEGRLDLTNIRYIHERDFPRWTKRVTPEPGDVVFSYEATLHRYVVIPEGFDGCLGRRLALIRPDREKILPRFLHYYLLSPYWRSVAGSAVINGATVDRISLKLVRDLPVRHPDLTTQERIVEILSAYDDLIENNSRRMALLEESVRHLYHEWFVRLCFPGHEHTRITHGVPKGWTRRTLTDCASFQSGGTPKKSISEYWEGTIPWISSGEMTHWRIHDSVRRVTEDGARNGTRMVPKGTIFAVVRGMSLAKEFRVAMCSGPMTFNQDLKAIAPRPGIRTEYLYSALLSQRDQIRDRATEASHGTKKLDSAVLSSTTITVPTDRLQDIFCEVVIPMHELWDRCWNQNAKLKTARDILLPRLMTGEVPV